MIKGYLMILGAERSRMIVYLIWAAVFGVAQGLSMVLLVPIARDLFDGDLTAAGRWLLVLVPVVAFCAVTFYVQSLKSMRTAVFTMRTLHHRLGDHLVTLPLGWFSREKVGSVSQIAVKGTMFVGSAGAHLITPVVTNLISSITVVVGVLIIDWRIGIVAVIGAVVLWGVGGLSSRMIAEAEARNHGAVVEVNNRVLEFARHQPVLRAFGRAGDRYEPLDDALTGQHRVGRQVMWRSVLGIMLNGVAVQLVFTAIIVVGAWLAVTGRIEAALLVAVIGLAARFTDPIAELALLGSSLRMATAEIDRIAAILDTDAMPQPDHPKAVTTPGLVEIDHVGFSYEGEATRRVLADVDVRLPTGSMTALVGPSGSGKTTITRLIARFYDVDSGAVRVGGVDVRDLDPATLMDQLSLVFQDVYLFDDTLWDNIRIGRPAASDDDIRAAAATAGVTSIVDRLPDGWRTRVGEGGSALSGGERQRVSIARALLKNAPIVLFDEATSALDPANEAHVAASIRALAEHSTVLVIAHKLSTVVAADQIVVLDDAGHVDDIGTHDELLARGGRYTDFWDQRSAAAGWTMAAAGS
jgi:ATP-binding cassette, subfamily B, bacterial IrtB/YbtQ